MENVVLFMNLANARILFCYTLQAVLQGLRANPWQRRKGDVLEEGTNREQSNQRRLSEASQKFMYVDLIT